MPSVLSYTMHYNYSTGDLLLKTRDRQSKYFVSFVF